MRRPFVEPFVQAESPYLHDWNTAWFNDDVARPYFGGREQAEETDLPQDAA